jgi:uncharacterized membrane protein YcfT
MNGVSDSKDRISWVDVARGIAVLWMIETHVCNAFLADSLKQTPFFARLNYLNGLVAPTFLTVSGYLLGLAILRKRGVFPSRFWLRLLGIFGWGYALHFPVQSLLSGDWSSALSSGCVVDVLQCLAVSQALFVVCARAGRPLLGAAVLTGFFVLAAPSAYRFTDLPIPIQGYLNPSTGALFPLFPWAGFVGLGVVAGLIQKSSVWWVYAFAGFVFGFLLPKPEPFTGASLPFFCERLGWVCLGLGLLQGIGGNRFPSLLHETGRRSLLMYVGHLVVMGMIWGIWQRSGGVGIGVWAAVVFWVGLVGSLILWGRFWERIKRIKES